LGFASRHPGAIRGQARVEPAGQPPQPRIQPKLFEDREHGLVSDIGVEQRQVVAHRGVE
jgi:hypothetical protein